jgi:hypothetical protein
MLTSFPNLDLFNSAVQCLRDDFEARYLPDGGLLAKEGAIMRAYAQSGKIPYVSDIAAGALSGRWGLGNTQMAVSEELGIERTRLSDALRKGEMSIESYLSLRFSPERPDDLEPPPAVMADMVRHGFIGAARYLARQVDDRDTLHPEDLDPVRHELLCTLLAQAGMWVGTPVAARGPLALKIVTETCDGGTRSIIPNWYTDKQKRATRASVAEWSSSEAAANHFLNDLFDNWADIYIAAAHATEGKHWRNLKDCDNLIIKGK